MCNKISEALALKNGRKKYYVLPDGTKKLWDVTVFPNGIYKPNGLELCEECKAHSAKPKKGEGTQDEENRRKSYNRAKNNLFDILMSNADIGYFVTMTFDGERVNRYDYGEVVKKLGVWLDNNVRRNGLRYVLVPEFHKDGAVHFHGFMNAESLKIDAAISPKTGRPLTAKGKQIYNITAFPYGFTTAIKVGENTDERTACAKYIYKYITKTNGEKVGGRYYLSGGNLKKPVFEYFDCNYFDVPAEPLMLSYGGEVKKIRASDFENFDLTFLGV